MLKKRYRLKNKKAFDATYNLKQVVSNSLLILYVGKKKTKDDVDTKFGFIASKKYHKRAVKRNLLKRRIRESYRKQKHNLNIDGGLDVLFMYSTKESGGQAGFSNFVYKER